MRAGGDAWITVGLGALVGLALAGATSARVARPDRARPRPHAVLAEADWQTRIAIERALAETEAAHQPRLESGVPALGEHAHFDGVGARIAVGDAHARTVTIGLAALGRESAMEELGVDAAAEIAGVEVRIVRARGVVEWWRSLPSGLEQGVTLDDRPTGDGALRLEMTVGEGVRAQLVSGHEVVLRSEHGELLARYAHLLVLDAAGERVPARLAVAGARIRIEIDDASARYPLVVDPVLSATEEAMLTATGGASFDQFGIAGALSADGSRALVGAHFDDNAGGSDAGSARVFLRTGTTWAQEATLLGSGAAAGDELGTAVALTPDGTRAFVSAYRDDTATVSDAGSVRVFLRTGTTWAEEATLLAAGGATLDFFGISIAVSSDGSRALVGSSSDDTAGGMNAGSAHVFLRTGTTWAEEATLVAAAAAAEDRFGWSVAMSSDGSLAVVGVPNDDAEAGSARFFARTGTTWTERATLLASDGAAADLLGISVALSADGSLALVGADGDDTPDGADAGSARLFARTGTTWAEAATLLAAGAAPLDRFGRSVALSADGSLALVGADLDDTVSGAEAGSARVFLRAGTTWSEDAMLLASSGAAGDWFGSSVALSADGGRALVGAFYDDNAGGTDAGSASVFTLVRGAANGTPCGTDVECLTGSCADGVCCESRCGGSGSSDCQACSAALTGVASGTCAPLAPMVAAGVTCRPAADVCDVAERCEAASTTCPADRLAPSATVCRPIVAACDASEESCTGTSPACPADAVAPPGTVCRPEAGPCDSAEVCDGVSPSCPGNAFEPSGNVCGTGMGDCAAPAMCTGTSAACPSTGVRPLGTLCRVAAGPCDLADTCDGTSALCVDLFATDTTLCGSAPSDACDAADHCAGTSATCVATYLSGVECRAATGTCDLAEVCAGTAAICPPDGLLSAGVSCRASTDTRCDPEEMCDGVAAACPADVTTCTPPEDAGSARDVGTRDDGGTPTSDVGAPSDTGAPSVAIAGCGCRVRTRASTSAGLAALSLGAVLAARRRRLSRGPARCGR